MQLTRLDHPPETPDVPGVEIVTSSAEAFADAVGEFQRTTAEQRAAYLEQITHSPLATRTVVAVADGRPVGTGTVMLEVRSPAFTPW